jgi:hypothetical protein
VGSLLGFMGCSLGASFFGLGFFGSDIAFGARLVLLRSSFAA